jgi:hypothetical protein
MSSKPTILVAAGATLGSTTASRQNASSTTFLDIVFSPRLE